GEGANAYMQLSGTSMAAGVVSGAVALLMEERPNLKPADAKAALQLTSTFLPSAGFVGAGAGELNVVGAVELIARSASTTTEIAGEAVESSGIATTLNPDKLVGGDLSGPIAYSRRANWTRSSLNSRSNIWGTNERN